MKAREMLEEAVKKKKKNLTEWEASLILKEYHIPVVEGEVARNLEEGLKIGEDLGYPLVLKVLSSQILHKSDEGLVILDIQNKGILQEAWQDLQKKMEEKKEKIEGILVQKMAPKGIELIIGANKDPSFGPVLLFGLGGIFVEVFHDISLRLIPIHKRDAVEMVKDIKGYPLLNGIRGREPGDMDFLLEILLKVSQMVEDLPHIKELDLNPFFLYPQGGMAVDALITLDGAESKGG